MARWSLKTIILGLLVLIITASLFIALPVVVPAYDSVDLKKVTWACTYYGVAPENLDTWTWILPGQPDKDTWIKVHLYQYAENDIRDNLHRTTEKDKYGAGGLNISVNPDNEDQIIISGYLHYGTFSDEKDLLNNTLPESPVKYTPENEIYRDIPVNPVVSELILDRYPFPVMEGVLSNRLITITMRQIYEGRRTADSFQVWTDENGFFTAILEPDEEADYYTVYAGFAGETIFPKNTQKKVEYPVGQGLPKIVTEPTEEREPVIFYFDTTTIYTTFRQQSGVSSFFSNRFIWLLIGLMLVAGIYGYFRYFRRRVRYRGDPGVEEITEKPTIETEEKIKRLNIEETSNNIIVFPEIEFPLPSVWGNGELLQVMFNRKDEESNVELRIEWGDDNEPETAPSAQGRRILTHMFTLPGEYVIKAGYQDKSGKEFSSWRKIRIVDYREEMVRLFGEMLEELNLGDVKIEPDMTPREVEEILAGKLEGVSRESLRNVIIGFEEANYSTHPVNRESYVRMYRAIREVRGRSGQDG